LVSAVIPVMRSRHSWLTSGAVWTFHFTDYNLKSINSISLVDTISGLNNIFSTGTITHNIKKMNKVVTLGEIMLRLAPQGFLRFSQAQSFNAIYGGGESNVAVSLANYGIPVDFVTRLPDNDIGHYCYKLVSHISSLP